LDQLFLFKSKTCRSSEQTEDSSRVKKSYLGSQLSLDPISYGLQALTFGKGCGFSLLIIVFGPGFGESHCFFLWFSQWKQKKCAVDRICKNLAGIKKTESELETICCTINLREWGRGAARPPRFIRRIWCCKSDFAKKKWNSLSGHERCNVFAQLTTLISPNLITPCGH
jgi:hypothetical protein